MVNSSEYPASVRAVLDAGVRLGPTDSGITPGGVLCYGDEGRHVATVPFGRSHWPAAPENDGGRSSQPVPSHRPWPEPFAVSADTIYDIASLTKPVAAAASFMKLDLDPHEPAIRVLPELAGAGPGAERITFAHLLGHTSGLPAHIEFYKRLRAGDRAGAATPAEALYAMVASTPLEAEPGERERYSDLGYIALGVAIERASGLRLARAVAELVLEPLGMGETSYVELPVDTDGNRAIRPHRPNRPTRGRTRVPRARTAPTEVCPYRGLVHGEVHDDNAHAGGGVFGHAGLFSTGPDVARFARAALSWLDGRGVGGFAPEVARRFATETGAPGAIHTLGWDRPSPAPARTHTGTLWPRDSVGHLGFTGCALWLDPPRGRYVALLTNRVHPSRDVVGIREFRGAVMDAVVRALDRSE